MNKFIIKTTYDYVKINISEINYANIENRSICYHLKQGETIESQKLRTTFEKSIGEIKNESGFLFVHPALLLNLKNIKS